MGLINVYRKIRYWIYCKQEDRRVNRIAQLSEDKYPEALRKMYKKITGKELNLENPQTYNEKIQWSKIYDSTKEKTMLADKYAVREWVKNKIGEEYLIPLIDAWDTFDEIDFNTLPDAFVLKLNNGSATNIIVSSKEQFNIKDARKKFKKWMETPFAFKGLELQYRDIVPKICCEVNLVPGGGDLPDYKFFCFDGKVFCSYTMVDYTQNHENGKLGFFDRDYRLMPYHRKDFAPITEQLEKPINYWKMVELAETLSAGFSHVRVDFYNINGKIYFGEMTFTNSSGYAQFEPSEFDIVLGKQWTLPMNVKNNSKI
ncbi:ATP-grasp fold amidoligase family protein [Agathobacter sp.]